MQKILSSKQLRYIVGLIFVLIAGIFLQKGNGSFSTSRPTLSSYALPTEGIGLVDVSHVADGDTIVVNINDYDVTVRLYGVDTPETVKPNTPVACYGEEASEHTKSLLHGKKVRLEPDPTQDRIDKYGRTLAYVYREDGLFINEDLVKNGFAREYTYKKPYQFQSEFRADESAAKSEHLGLWNPIVCPFGSFSN